MGLVSSPSKTTIRLYTHPTRSITHPHKLKSSLLLLLLLSLYTQFISLPPTNSFTSPPNPSNPHFNSPKPHLKSPLNSTIKMKIPKTLIPQISPVSQTPSTSSSSSCHSTISSSSSAVIAATASSSLSPSPSSSPSRRCEGLDLLVKAIYQVDEGSVIGVPYIQRRIIRRRKPAIRFANPFLVDHDQLDLKRRSDFKCLKPKRRRSCKG